MPIQEQGNRVQKWTLYGFASATERAAYKRTAEFKKYVSFWSRSGCNSARRIGRVMELIRAAEPANLAEWEYAYLTTGRSLVELMVVAKEFQRFTGLGRRAALVTVLIHIIDETFDGYEGEKAALALLQSVADASGRPIEFRYSSEELDRQFSIDIVGYEEGHWTIGIQVKPKSYFFENVAVYSKQLELENLKQLTAALPDLEVYYLSTEDIRKGYVRFRL